jgi:hypothetical protein
MVAMFFALIYVGLGILVVFVVHRWFTSSVPVPLLIVGGIGVLAVFFLLASWGGKWHGNQSDVQGGDIQIEVTQPFILYEPDINYEDMITQPFNLYEPGINYEYLYEPGINYEYLYEPGINYEYRYEPDINYEYLCEPDINWNSQYPITGKPGTRKP